MGRLAACFVISVATALSSAAFATAFDFKYLSSASNDAADTLLVSHGNPSQDDRHRVAVEACSSLQQLLGDPQLPELIELSERGRAEAADKKTLQLIYYDLGMLNRFASTEAEKLRSAGYNPAAIAQIIADLSLSRPGPVEAMPSVGADLSPSRPGPVEARPPVGAIVSKLSYVICAVSKRTEVSNDELAAIGVGLGGVALLGVDVFVPGLEGFAPASADVGAALISKAIEAL